MLYSVMNSPVAIPEPLHVPDGFLSVPVAVAAWIVTAIFVLVAVRKASREFEERMVPLMGILAAFIFAAQAFNFPVAGGTSGHFLGGALAAILLGPWPALLVMTAVIALQALIFQDGGLLAMGANIFIMGIVTVWIGYFTYRALASLNRFMAAFVAGWLSMVMAAAVTAFLLAISSTSALGIVLPAMTVVHAVIGIGEGLITAAALALVQAALPGYFGQQVSSRQIETSTLVAGGVVGALLIGILAVFFASPSPDGLESVAEELGFLGSAQGPAYEVIPDYVTPGLANETAAAVLAIMLGTLLLFGVGFAVARLLRRRSQRLTEVPATVPASSTQQQ
jgi:cobalt/nickel transport system permease protein